MILQTSHYVNATTKELGTMHRAEKIPIANINKELTCTLCSGYFIDATTIIECLHSFCRSCIVKYLQTNKYCPVCEVQIHKTKPLLNIRPDKILQDIVYKLVPRLFQNETQRRKQYYTDNPEAKPSGLEQRGEASYQHVLSPDETICLSFNYHGRVGTPRYLQCPAAVSIQHLQKLIRAKYDLTDNHRLDILYNQDALNTYLTLMDIACIYLWRRKGPLELTYRIYENTTKRIKLEDAELSVSTNNNDWKEVQLRISENGEMSVTGIQDCLDLLDSTLDLTKKEEEKVLNVIEKVEMKKPEKPVKKRTKKDLPALKLIKSGTASVTDVQTEEICDSKIVEKSTGKKSTDNKKNLINSKINAKSSKTSSEVSTNTQLPDGMKNCAQNSTDSDVKCASSTSVSTNSENTAISVSNTDTCAVTNFASTLTSFGTSATAITTTSTSSAAKTGSTTTATCTTSRGTKKSSNGNRVTKLNEVIIKGVAKIAETMSSTAHCPTPNTMLPSKAVESKNGNNIKNDGKRKFDVSAAACVDEEPAKKQSKSSIMNQLQNLTNHAPILNGPSQKGTTNNVKEVVSDINLKSTENVVLKTTTAPNTVVSMAPNAITSLSTSKTVTSPSVSETQILPQSNDLNPAPNISQSTDLSAPKIPQSSIATFTKPSFLNKNFTPAQNNRPGTPITTQKWAPTKPSAPAPPCYMPKPYSPVINVPKPSTSAQKTEPPQISTTQSSMIVNNKPIKTKQNVSLGYKTLRDPPKTWNPQIARAAPTKQEPTATDLKNVRPAKFFKMRNNMPRYLGNPASGVKPMYKVHVSPEKDKNVAPKNENTEIKKHSIVKIDPKTLKPISERAPETSSLTNHQQQPDLKINTSSVSIFNPLKLQSSPKSDRKSPKSPHSPKKSPPAKRDKMNLNYTPPNPYIPNLSSPQVNPNQFLYPSAPGSFPSYDPRVMAAYHTLFMQRLPFPSSPLPGLGMDLNRKYEHPVAAASTTSPKTPPSASGSGGTAKVVKKAKEAKAEKSLQNAVEKLTQNKIKESIRNDEGNPKNIQKTSESAKVDERANAGGLQEKSSNNNNVKVSLQGTEK